MSGTGRGRGWLKIKNNQESPRPGSTMQDQVQTNNPQHLPSPKEVFDSTQVVPTQFTALIAQINSLDGNDDGILFNHKLQNIVSAWKETCTTENDVKESLKCIYRICLSDSQFVAKAIKMLNSRSCSKLAIQEVKVCNQIIPFLQRDYENRVQNRLQNAYTFRNSVKLLGTFYFYKSRLGEGMYKVFVQPLTDYFSMLLESAQAEDLAVFVEQLYLNGSAIRSVMPQKLDELLLQVRRLLLSKEDLTKKSRAWLLLALDVSFRFRVGMLPTELFKFYQEELGEKALAEFQGWFDELYIEIDQAGKTLENYASPVNVLQLSTPEVSPVNHRTSPPDTLLQMNPLDGNISQSFGSSNDSGVKVDKWVNPAVTADTGRKKAGRPILGVGARMKKDGDGLGGGNAGEELFGSRRGRRQHPKGWDHDDRLENDYS